MISGILAGGSLVSALSFVASCTLQVAHGVFVVFPLLSYVMGLRNMTHKLSSACAEMILSYHLLPQQIFFTHNWNLSRHCCVVVCFLFVFCVVCFCLCLFFCVVFAFGSLCFGSFSFERDKGIGLCIGPLPVDCCGPTAWPLRELIN